MSITVYQFAQNCDYTLCSKIKNIAYKSKGMSNIENETLKILNYYYESLDNKAISSSINKALQGDHYEAWGIAYTLSHAPSPRLDDDDYIDEKFALISKWLIFAAKHGSPLAMVDLACGFPYIQPSKYSEKEKNALLDRAYSILAKAKNPNQMEKNYLEYLRTLKSEKK